MSELFPEIVGGHHDGRPARRWVPNPTPGARIVVPEIVGSPGLRANDQGVEFAYHQYVVEPFRLGHRGFLVLCSDTHRAHQRDARDRAVIDRLLAIAGIAPR